ncbi:LamG-like jellyroll fold domain-containing protein [Streptomyces sp. SCL15-4]|uniref:LamG-like jellyroll fold domain-containing protein n=1 Tax=Streptomyces sp. SCL15-4 TaxID=2967221 RepID=UPI002967649F|nr:LamG-like jellyroll fold domain-containing protein [Streptomyces sp. SCL15-4]
MPLLVEMGWGGVVQLPATITWTDVTPYTDVVQGVAITRGAADELAETQPGTATVILDNSDGRFTPGNTASPYYPYVRRNAPIRISAVVIPTKSGILFPRSMAQLGDAFDDGQVNTSRWPTNTHAVETADGRLRIPLAPGVDTSFASAREWTLRAGRLTAKLVTVPQAGGSTNAAASMWVTSTTSGTRIGWRYDAVAGVLAAMSQVGFSDPTPVTLPYSAIDHVWLRVRETAGTVYWETSGDGYTWTVRRTLATPSWVTSETHAAEFPTTRTGGTGDVIEWALVGGIVFPRFYGMVNEFPVDWEGLVSKVRISCTDLFKRLNRLPALRSMLVEEIIQHGSLVYYPLTEPAESVTCGDLSGAAGPSLSIAQSGSGGTLALATIPGPAEATEQLPQFTPSSATAGKWLTADLGAAIQQQLTGQRMVMEAWFQTTTGGRAVAGIASPDLQYQHILSLTASGTLQIEWTIDGTVQADVITAASGLADGRWHHVLYDQRTSAVWVDGIQVATTTADWGYNERVLHVGGYRGTRLWSGSVGHVAVYAAPSASGATLASHYNAGATGFAGETADVRIARLASYAQIPSVTIAGTVHDPIASQGPAGSTVVARMREVESTESARLFADRASYGMTYQSRGLRYNPSPGGEAFSVAYADLETRSVEVADDDQKLVNDATGSRPGGATQRVTAASSVLAFGAYPQELTVLKTSDNSVLDALYWLVSRYANPGPELREVPIEASTLSTYQAILAADISSYFSVTGLPSQAPASSLRVTIEGYTETIRQGSHLIQFHTSATTTDSVWVLDDATYSVLDSTTRLAY